MSERRSSRRARSSARATQGAASRKASSPAPSATHFLEGGGVMGARLRAFNWAKTPLGPPEEWPDSLKTAVSICLNSRFPMVIWWGPELVLIYNDGWRPILGENKDRNALGSRGEEVWREIWDVLYPMFSQVLYEGQSTWTDDGLLLVDRYGYIEEAYFTWSYSPIKNDDGSVGGVFTAVTETTARVVGERRLKTLRDLGERLAQTKSPQQACQTAAATLAENSKDVSFGAIYLLREDGKVAELTGVTGIEASSAVAPGEIAIGSEADVWRFGDVLAGRKQQLLDDIPVRIGKLPAGAWADDFTRRVAVVPLAKAGVHELPAGFLVAGVSPRLKHNDEYRGFFDLVGGHIATAIANTQAYEMERKRAQALLELDRAKTTFFSNVSHELRTPLTLMLGPIDEIVNKPDDAVLPENRALAELAHRNGLRLLKLVNTLLDFSRIEAGRIQATYEPLDLAALTRDIASGFRSAIEKAGLKFVIDCPPLPAAVYVDRDMWEKIVLNLLSNAFKFTFDGEIRLSLAWRGEQVELSVSDTGAGIPAEELPRIFERFHRVQGTRSRTQEGTGIGLALVQELARLHGGTVTVQSVVNRGTVFTVAIQTGRAHLPPERIGAERTSLATTTGAEAFVAEVLTWAPPEAERGTQVVSSRLASGQPLAGRPSPDSPRILIADDNADMRAYVQRLLSPLYQVEAVSDGQAGLEAARQRRPDLVLTDVMMPRLDGFGLLAALREDDQTRTIPVVMLSARAGEEARVEGLKAGADDYLVKPFSARELLARVQSQLAMARLRRETEEKIRQSEAQLRLFIEHAPTAIAMFDREMRYLAASRRWRLDYGLRDNIVGRSHYEIFPEIPERWREVHRRALAGEILSADEDPFPRQDGSIQWIKWEVHPWHTPGGEIGGILIAAEEVTERVQTSQALRENEEQLRQSNLAIAQRLLELQDSRRAALNLMADAVQAKDAVRQSEERFRSLVSVITDVPWTTDAEGRFVHRQSSWEAYTGQAWEEHRDFGWENAVHSDDRPRVRGAWESARRNRKLLESQGRLWHAATQQHRHVVVRATPLFKADGAIREWVGSCTDVDDQVRAKENLERTITERTAKLRETIAELESYSYSISHDMRAPLRAMQAYSQVLVDELGPRLDETHRRYLERIMSSSVRMDKLITDVLSYSRISRAEIDLRPVHLDPLLEEITYQYPALQSARIDIAPNLGTVMAAEALLTQAIANLLTNAVKFVGVGQTPHIRVWSENSGPDLLRLYIQDSGIGIAPEDQRRIFNIFVRVHSPAEYDGTGIGLSVVKRAVERMGGAVGLQSQVGKGSTFWLELKKA